MTAMSIDNCNFMF